MKRRNMLKIENYFQAGFLIFLLILFFFLIKDYMIAILLALTFVFLSYKPYKKLTKSINEYSAASIIVLIGSLIIFIPGALFSINFVQQTGELIQTSNEILNNVDLSGCEFTLCNQIERYISQENIRVEDFIIGDENAIFSYSPTGFISVISHFLLDIMVFLLAYFYLLKDGHHFLKYLRRITPMKNEFKDALFLKFRDVTEAVFINSLFIAFIQGSMVALGLWVIGIQSPIFWGTIAAFFALIPMIGPAAVWFPVTIYLFLIESYLAAVGLFIYGSIIIGFTDNILRPILLEGKANAHPFLILLSILGGISVFGFIGVFVGPILISLLVSVIEMYDIEFV